MPDRSSQEAEAARGSQRRPEAADAAEAARGSQRQPESQGSKRRPEESGQPIQPGGQDRRGGRVQRLAGGRRDGAAVRTSTACEEALLGGPVLQNLHLPTLSCIIVSAISYLLSVRRVHLLLSQLLVDPPGGSRKGRSRKRGWRPPCEQ